MFSLSATLSRLNLRSTQGLKGIISGSGGFHPGSFLNTALSGRYKYHPWAFISSTVLRDLGVNSTDYPKTIQRNTLFQCMVVFCGFLFAQEITAVHRSSCVCCEWSHCFSWSRAVTHSEPQSCLMQLWINYQNKPGIRLPHWLLILKTVGSNLGKGITHIISRLYQKLLLLIHQNSICTVIDVYLSKIMNNWKMKKKKSIK